MLGSIHNTINNAEVYGVMYGRASYVNDWACFDTRHRNTDLEKLVRESDHQEAHEGAVTKRVGYQVDEVENHAAERMIEGRIETEDKSCVMAEQKG